MIKYEILRKLTNRSKLNLPPHNQQQEIHTIIDGFQSETLLLLIKEDGQYLDNQFGMVPINFYRVHKNTIEKIGFNLQKSLTTRYFLEKGLVSSCTGENMDLSLGFNKFDFTTNKEHSVELIYISSEGQKIERFIGVQGKDFEEVAYNFCELVSN